MSGLAGRFFVGRPRPTEAERDQLARSFAGVNREPSSYVDDDVELFVAGRFDAHGGVRSFGELVIGERYVVALEGYLLNVDELQGGAERAGQGMTRAERVLALYLSRGETIFERFNGGYSLVIWDRADRAAVIVTCKFGQRTLYSRPAGGGLAFASDLHALRRISGAPFELDPATIGMGLLYGGVQGRATTLRGVTKVLPGTILTLKENAVAERLAVDVPRPGASAERRNRAFYVEQLDAAMRQAAVRLAGVARTHAVMLGSGVDSSLVASYALPAMPELVALTQKMPGDDDESGEAAKIAGALGMPQTVVPYVPRPSGLLEEVAAFVRIAEEPAYWNQLGPPLLRLLGSVAEPPEAFLTGAEGDFLFIFRSGRRPSASQVVKDGIFWPVASFTARRLINRVTRHTYVVGTDFDLLDRRFMRQHIAVDCTAYEGIEGHFDPSYPHLADGPNAQRHFINNGWQNVRIIGQFGQNIGAEVLFPYMDDDVVSCVLSLPDELKINKGLLRILLAQSLPGVAVTSRKRGYWAHTIKWHYDLRALDEVLGLMLEPRTLERGVYDSRAIEALVDTYARRTATGRDHPVLWQLLLFEMFCREFIDRPRTEP